MNIPFNIFPVGPHKRPLIQGWQDKATRDPATIARWEANGVTAWGIPTGARNGLFVVDLDVDRDTGDRVGETSLASLGRYADLIDKVNVRTPSGGAHIYFQHFKGARNSTSKLSEKIDTRGEGGYVIAPGSITSCGTYRGTFPVLGPVPLGLRALLLRKPAPKPRRSFNRDTPVGEVQDLLRHIPADLPYGDWLAVLMALHDRFSGSHEGLALADAWSATGAKYRPGEVASKWASFQRSGVNWATIPAMARRHGADLSDVARGWVS